MFNFMPSRRNFLAGIAAVAVPSGGKADSLGVAVGTSVADRAVWVGNALYMVNSRRDYAKAALAKYYVELYKENPGLSPVEALQRLNKAQATYNQQAQLAQGNFADFGKTPHDAINSMFNIVATLDRFKAPAAIVREAYEWSYRAMKATLEPDVQVFSQMQLYSSYTGVQEYQAEQWKSAWDTMQTNSAAKAVGSVFFAPYFNASPEDSARKILEKNPAFASAEGIAEISRLLGEDGKIAVSLGELKTQYATMFNGVRASLAANRALLTTIDGKQAVMIAYADDQQSRAALEQQVMRQRRVDELKFQAAGSGVFLLSTLVSFADQRAGAAIAVAGNSALQIADAISKYTSTAAQLGNIGVSLGSVILTGNMVGAALKIFSLFSDSGTSPEKLVLDQLSALREDIGQLRQEMHSRFDRIDASLNRIYDMLHTRFDQIDFQLGRLNGNLADIQSSLFTIQSDLNRLERSMAVFLNDATRIELREAINGGLDYRRKFGKELPYDGAAPNYVSLENRFHTWATQVAGDQIRAGLNSYPGEDLSDGRAYVQLTSHPLETNLNYLNDYLGARYGQELRFAEGRMINPRDWSVGVEAYLTLAREWPEYDKRVSIERLGALETVGTTLAGAFQSIALRQTTAGLSSNTMLFDRLIRRYNDKATAFVTALATLYDDYKAGIVTDERQPFNRRLDLWGGAAQHTEYKPAFSEIAGCNPPGRKPFLDAVPDLESFVPPAARLAELLDLGRNTVCLDQHIFTYVRFQETSLSGPTRTSYGRWLVGLIGFINGQQTFHRMWISPQEREIDVNVRNTLKSIKHTDYDQYLRSNWNEGEKVRSRFVAEAKEFPAVGDISKISQTVELKLREHQVRYYNKVVDALNIDSLLNRSAIELSGAKAVLSSLVALALSRSLESDDLLRSLLYGAQSLPDRDAILAFYRNALTDATSDSAKPLATLDLTQTLHDRSEALKQQVTNTLLALERQQSGQSQRLLEITLGHLKVHKSSRIAG